MKEVEVIIEVEVEVKEVEEKEVEEKEVEGKEEIENEGMEEEITGEEVGKEMDMITMMKDFKYKEILKKKRKLMISDRGIK